jgi:hypothetical protein
MTQSQTIFDDLLVTARDLNITMVTIRRQRPSGLASGADAIYLA